MASWRYQDDNATHLSREDREEREMAGLVIVGLLLLLSALHWGPGLIESVTHLF